MYTYQHGDVLYGTLKPLQLSNYTCNGLRLQRKVEMNNYITCV